MLPLGKLSLLPALAALAGSVLLVAVIAGLVDSLMARLAFRRVPLLLTTVEQVLKDFLPSDSK